MTQPYALILEPRDSNLLHILNMCLMSFQPQLQFELYLNHNSKSGFYWRVDFDTYKQQLLYFSMLNRNICMLGRLKYFFLVPRSFVCLHKWRGPAGQSGIQIAICVSIECENSGKRSKWKPNHVHAIEVRQNRSEVEFTLHLSVCRWGVVSWKNQWTTSN